MKFSKKMHSQAYSWSLKKKKKKKKSLEYVTLTKS